MTFVPHDERPKRRHFYISDRLWRQLKATLALEGKSVSQWLREEAKKKIKLLVLIVVVSASLFLLGRFVEVTLEFAGDVDNSF